MGLGAAQFAVREIGVDTVTTRVCGCCGCRFRGGRWRRLGRRRRRGCWLRAGARRDVYRGRGRSRSGGRNYIARRSIRELTIGEDQGAVLDALLDIRRGDGLAVEHVNVLHWARDNLVHGDALVLVEVRVAVSVAVVVRLRIGADQGCGQQRDGDMHCRSVAR
jgi:hypothetical protein